jgi:tetratricopeptide (TPR) repeat protein
MPAESHKKWIVVGIIALLAVVISVVVITTEDPYKPEQKARKITKSSPPPSGPLVDVNPNRIAPMEQVIADTDDPEALASIGDRYFEGGNYSQAIKAYEKVLELNPKDVDTHNDLGLAYYYTKKSELAVNILRKGTELRPDYQRIWLSLGYVALSSGSTEEGRSALNKAIEMDPDTDMGQEAKRLLSLLKQ